MLMNLKELVKKYDMDIKGVYHIGANTGQELDTYHELGIELVTMFEPNQRCVDIVNNRIRDENFPIGYTINQCALGDMDMDEVTLYDSSNGSQSASILKPKAHLIQHPNVKFNGSFTAPMRQLDMFNDGISNFINIDVQGFELQVFNGGMNVLNNIDYIMTEVNYQEIYEECTDYNWLVAYMNNLNFDLVSEYNTGHGWGDALFIKGYR